ncbi:FRG domain-containing protein [Photobacterium sp. TY1-4]|uniref:FRG domain-containing protein n=1 Tax=Photobacterium sp. TY1-4 TaxID=2899122 RepID=UPI0021BF1B25|nr:FRG domain-containing protein [Photobacterium sp. TY1-4]UXI00099.1 FRG domain-containing protein [Photobacterium sp. TY1-4]
MQTSTYIGSVSSYLAVVRELTADSELALFRGQPNRRRALLPPIARHNQPVSTAVERQMLAMFQQYGEFTPKEAHTWDDQASNWHLLSQAQQFGMKTRLMAWSQNPLIALWFACQRGAPEPYVYLFRADGLDEVDFTTDPLAISQTRVFSPIEARPEATAQRSWYSIHPSKVGSDGQVSPQAQGFVPLEQELYGRDRLLEIPLLRAMKSKLLAELATYGINERTVYPGLDGLCQHLNHWLTAKSAGVETDDEKLEVAVNNLPSTVAGKLFGYSGIHPRSLDYQAVASAPTESLTTGHSLSGLRQYRRQYTADFDFD